MILAANQPYFFPYLGWWQLIKAADLFLVSDDYNFIRRGWVTRNRILVNGKAAFFRIEVKERSSFKLIKDLEILPPDNGEKLRTLEMAYHKAPCLDAGMALAERVLGCPERNLALFLENSIKEVCSYLGITTPIGRTSDLPGNSRFKREERIYDFCARTGADTYVNAIGGMRLYDPEEFAKRGVKLLFLKSGLPEYPQHGAPFVSGLSILDAIMFNSKEALGAMLDDYTLIEGRDG